MTDKYADIRAALDAATPGPWEASEHQWPEQVGCCPLVGRPYSICDMDRKNIAAATSFGTAVYIAAASPEAIRALLAERDALREALEMMVEMIEMNGFGFHYVMDVARAALAQEQGEKYDNQD